MVVSFARFELDDARNRIDHDAVWSFLSGEAGWGRWRTRDDIEVQLSNAWRLVGAYEADGSQVGFARAISDGRGIAYLADVYVLERYRAEGLGRALVEYMISGGSDFRWMLHTNDAHGFYGKMGFVRPDETYLERPSPLAKTAPET